MLNSDGIPFWNFCCMIVSNTALQEALIAAQAPLKYFHAPPPKGIFMADSVESLARAWVCVDIFHVVCH
jgi:hypothetical protein